MLSVLVARRCVRVGRNAGPIPPVSLLPPMVVLEAALYGWHNTASSCCSIRARFPFKRRPGPRSGPRPRRRLTPSSSCASTRRSQSSTTVLFRASVPLRRAVTPCATAARWVVGGQFQYAEEERKPAIPSRKDKPVMGLQSRKNFVSARVPLPHAATRIHCGLRCAASAHGIESAQANAIDNILAVPKQPMQREPDYLSKPDYGTCCCCPPPLSRRSLPTVQLAVRVRSASATLEDRTSRKQKRTVAPTTTHMPTDACC